jgi:alcohol dehydrogenase (cytochrome c)
MNHGGNESTPLVYDGVMFLGNPNDVIQAIDAASGELLWQYTRTLPSEEDMASITYDHKRSIALWGDKVYVTSRDNWIYALDARTGQLVWETDRGGELFAGNATGPIVVDGVVLAGGTCQRAGFGCYVTGHDANNGEELWRNEFIPHPGQPGDETWANTVFESRWCTGAWGPMIYDPQLDMLYYGSTGICPASEAQRGAPGATMAGTNTRYAVKPKTGEIVWAHQTLPRDNWDQECTFDMMVLDANVRPNPSAEGMLAVGTSGGERRTLTGMPCKTGIVWSFDAASGEFLWAKETVAQNIVANIDDKGLVTVNEDVVMKDVNKTYDVCPTYAGGRDWPPSAYNPNTKVQFFPIWNLCIDSKVMERDPAPAFLYNTQNTNKMSPGKEMVGRIDAISVETGETLWTWETPVQNYAGALATASGLLFNAGTDRYFRAHDQDTGNVLWEARLGSMIKGVPVTFSVDGRQYVAIAAGGRGSMLNLTPDADGPAGNNEVYVFALPRS